MKTAKEMVEFASNGVKLTKSMIKGFSLIEESLSSDENILYSAGVFLENKNSAQVAFAITDRRIMIAHKSMFSNDVIVIMPDMINDISLNKKFTGDFITIVTGKDILTISAYKNKGNDLISSIHSAMNSTKNSDSQNISAADEIVKYKKLLDEGIITESEFQLKKKQLLDL